MDRRSCESPGDLPGGRKDDLPGGRTSGLHGGRASDLGARLARWSDDSARRSDDSAKRSDNSAEPRTCESLGGRTNRSEVERRPGGRANHSEVERRSGDRANRSEVERRSGGRANRSEIERRPGYGKDMKHKYNHYYYIITSKISCHHHIFGTNH